MKSQGKKSKIILNIDSDLKQTLKKRCVELGLNMTDVIVSGIKDFIKDSNKHN